MDVHLQELAEQGMSLGDLIVTLHEHYLGVYPDDDDLAALATAEAVNRVLQAQKARDSEPAD